MSFWSYCVPLRLALSFLDFCAVYFATLLGRCAALSAPVLGLVLLLRKTVWKQSVFARGAAWAALLPVLFLGKLGVYYQSRAFLPLLYWQSWCGGYWWVRWGYLAGVLASLALLVRRRVKLQRMLRRLQPDSIGGQRVYLCDMPVSPFTAGLVSPKIVIPEIARRRLDESDLRTILLHERTHIRRAHLWYFLAWDVLCALLWVNPLLRLSTPKLKEDMERICDAATIRRGGLDAVSYGRVILKSMALLRAASPYPSATFAGEPDFADAKERMRRVRDYRPCSRGRAAAPAACTLCFLLLAALAVHQASLPRYTEITGFTVFQVVDDVEFVKVYDTNADERPPLTVTGKDAVAVDNAALRALLPAGSPEDGCYYIMWGGFLKLPGIGGAMNSVYVGGLSDGATTRAGFEDLNRLFYTKLAKWL